jgi:aminoglycoside phosphotransferase family enzyme/predicted kinase
VGNGWAEVAETHTAAVFFVGDLAFKVKKPVRLAFVDLRDRATRRMVCEREVTLNRRLSPDVYLGVGGLALPDGAEEPAVVMRRLPADRRLSRLVIEGSPLATRAVTDVARLLADFHERQPPCQAAGDRTPRMRRSWHRLLGEPGLSAGRIGAVTRRCRWLADRYLDGREPLFRERAGAGRVRDGHGDLQADDIFILDDGPRLLDCLEFDDDLRVDDVLLDVCFLAMDLERLGAPDLARRFLADYRTLTGETHPASLEHHFVAYRAVVRAAVSAIRRAQAGAGRDEGVVERLMDIAQGHLLRALPVLLLVGGLPGSGKTTLADEVARRRGWVVLSSDDVRRESRCPGEPVGWEAGSYTPAVTEAVYAELLRRAGLALERGDSVVLDASWRSAGNRAAARELARRTASLALEVRCTCPDAVAAARLESRTGSSSQATPDVRRRMREVFADWPESVEVRGDEGSADQALARLDEAVMAAAQAQGR